MGSVKCNACGKKVKLDIWAMCQALSHCYHCGGEFTPTVLNTLVKMAAGPEQVVTEEMP